MSLYLNFFGPFFPIDSNTIATLYSGVLGAVLSLLCIVVPHMHYREHRMLCACMRLTGLVAL